MHGENSERHLAHRHHVGFVGFGTMAQKMAARLREPDHKGLTYNPGGKGDGIDGPRWIHSASSPAGQVDAGPVSVRADAALEQSIVDCHGVLAGAPPPCFPLMDSSTVSLDTSRRVAGHAAAEGMRFVEAPVSGSTLEAESVDLIVLPVMAVISRKTVHAGPSTRASR